MGLHPDTKRISVSDYLQGELNSEIRHEYVGGDVYAMVGASDKHNIITGNLFATLHTHIRGTTCQLFMADMKVRISLQVASEEAFYYPDLMLACDPQDRATYFREKPCLLVEVLSEATERIDRREKLLAYTGIASLQEYILIHQNRMEVEIHRREDNWRAHVETEGEVMIECLNVTVPLSVIYEDIALQ